MIVFTRSEFQKTKETFLLNLMKNDDNEIYPKICEIHDAFDSLKVDNFRHNCLACNFADFIILIKYFFGRIETYESIQDIYFDYLLKLYLIIERIDMIFKLIKFPEEERLDNFRTMQDIRKWANFIKHPKAFVLTHHPNFLIEGDDEDEIGKYSLIINTKFVNNFYSNHKKNKELLEKLSNNADVLVLFPNPNTLMRNFANEVNKFQEIICNNDVYKEILSKYSTYENYFEEVDNKE